MSHPKIRPFTDEDLPAAAELLAQRHARDRLAEPLLSETYATAAGALAAIEAIWRIEGVSGVAAFQDERLVGYLIGAPKIDTFLGRTAWMALAGHALASDATSDLYRDLYAALSAQWVAQGIFAHFALVPASDHAALSAWFALSFGQEQCYAVRPLAPDASASSAANAEEKSLPVSAEGLTIRRATADDRDAMLAIGDIISRYQTRPPVYASYPPEIGPTSDEFDGILADPQMFLWLALRSQRILGYQLYQPFTAKDNPLIALAIPDHCEELAVGATVEDVRGQGVGYALTSHALARATSEGYGACLADWRTTNLLSSRFWPRMGFRPAAYRLARRLDERIAWAHR